MTFALVCCNSDNTDTMKKILNAQDLRNHRTTTAGAMFPIAAEWETFSVQRGTHHVAGDIGSSAFRSDCS